MTRFRQGTTDHDNDGKRGGSLRAGSRFVKGTNDHDGDGRKGGSLPKGDIAMVKMKGATPAEKKVVASAKKAAKRITRSDETAEAKKTVPAKKAAAEDQFARADAAVVGTDDDPGEFKLRAAGQCLSKVL